MTTSEISHGGARVESRQGFCTHLAVLLLASVAVQMSTGADNSLDGLLRHSQVALMPEGEPDSVEVLKPLGAEVVAWGADAVHYLEQPRALKERMDTYRELGVELLACNVWMLTATGQVLHDDPRYQDAVCRDIEGGRIVPRWLDGDYMGVPYYWGCTNDPLFRAQLIARAQGGIRAGANMLHLDDHMGTAAAAVHSGACFCDHCVTGFAQWLLENGSSEELERLGIEDAVTFSYRAYLRAAGFTTRELYDSAASEDRLPLREEFLTFQREAAIAFVREMRAAADEAAGHPVPVGVNAWNLAPTQLATSHAADYFANEISHYGVEDLEPPRAYLLAAALGKPVFSTGTGEDWIEVMRHGDVTRVQRWIATAHAFGEHFMYAYDKWGFSEETGTQWYQTPIETFEPIYGFITSHPALFDHYGAAPQVGVLYDNRANRNGKAGVAEIVRELHDAHYTVGLAVAGDEWLEHSLDEKQLQRFETVIVPPDIQLDGPQAEILDQWRRQGRTLAWTDIDAVRSSIQPWIQVNCDGRVWALPRVRTDNSSDGLVIHLLNQNQAGDSDTMIATGAVRISVGRELLGDQQPETATLHGPNHDPRVLPLEYSDGRCEFVVPEVDLWSVVAFD